MDWHLASDAFVLTLYSSTLCSLFQQEPWSPEKFISLDTFAQNQGWLLTATAVQGSVIGSRSNGGTQLAPLSFHFKGLLASWSHLAFAAKSATEQTEQPGKGQCGGELIHVLLHLRIQVQPCPLLSSYRHLPREGKQYCTCYSCLNKGFCFPGLLWINREGRKPVCNSLPFPRHLESPHKGGYNSKEMLVPLAAPPRSPLVGFCPGLMRIHSLWHYCSSH